MLQVVLRRTVDLYALSASLAALLRYSNAFLPGEILAGDAVFTRHDVLGRTLGNHFTAVDARAGADIHDPVRVHHGLLIMFYNNQGIAQITHVLEGVDQLHVVTLVESYARLIQHVQYT